MASNETGVFPVLDIDLEGRKHVVMHIDATTLPGAFLRLGEKRGGQ